MMWSVAAVMEVLGKQEEANKPRKQGILSLALLVGNQQLSSDCQRSKRIWIWQLESSKNLLVERDLFGLFLLSFGHDCSCWCFEGEFVLVLFCVWQTWDFMMDWRWWLLFVVSDLSLFRRRARYHFCFQKFFDSKSRRCHFTGKEVRTTRRKFTEL